MKLHIDQISLCGLYEENISEYMSTDKCIQMVKDIIKGDIMPPLIVYKQLTSDGKYVLADGIHRFCSYLVVGIKEFECILK